MSDLISRQAAINALAEMYFKSDEDGYAWIIRGDACFRIDALPSAERVGKWKYTDASPHWMYCDQCYKRIVPNKNWIKEYNIPTNYCPNCGARMDGEEG